MNLIEIFLILIIHFVANFCLQTDKQAKGKSNNWDDLISHTFNYSLCWFIIGVVIQCFTKGQFFDKWTVTAFFIITFIAHTITDYFTSRLNSRLWQQGKTHAFFVSIGADQIYHYLQLFLTYWILTK